MRKLFLVLAAITLAGCTPPEKTKPQSLPKPVPDRLYVSMSGFRRDASMPKDDLECANAMQRWLFVPEIGGDDGLLIEKGGRGFADGAITVERKRVKIPDYVRVACARTRARVGDGALFQALGAR